MDGGRVRRRGGQAGSLSATLTPAPAGPWTRLAADLAGETLVHSDLRDDNVIVADDGRVLVCDWSSPVLGPSWVDAVCLAISMFGDGLDADGLLRRSGAVSAADRDGVDCLLAHLVRYFVASAGQGENPGSPYLRAHQRWYAAVTAAWLRRRRGW